MSTDVAAAAAEPFAPYSEHGVEADEATLLRHLWGSAAGHLARGRLIVVPTDTVYGIVCDPRDPAAVERVYAAKERPAGLELPVLAAGTADLDALVDLGPVARRLGDRFWPGGLTIIAAVRPGAGLAVPRSGSTLAVRVPDHPLLRALLRVTGPLASTSANPHGRPAPAHAAEAAGLLGDAVAAVFDGGPAAGLPSTIIDCTATPPRVVREGALQESDLRPHLEG